MLRQFQKKVNLDLDFVNKNINDKDLEKIQILMQKDFEIIVNETSFYCNKPTILLNNYIEHVTQAHVLFRVPSQINFELLTDFINRIEDMMIIKYRFSKGSQLTSDDDNFQNKYIKYLEAKEETQ